MEKIDAMFPMHAGDNPDSMALKGDFRSLAGQLMARQETAQSQAAKRSLAEALTLLETASMYAVKAVHQG